MEPTVEFAVILIKYKNRSFYSLLFALIYLLRVFYGRSVSYY